MAKTDTNIQSGLPRGRIESDMTQFSQNIDKNTQKKQNSLQQLRF